MASPKVDVGAREKGGSLPHTHHARQTEQDHHAFARRLTRHALAFLIAGTAAITLTAGAAGTAVSAASTIDPTASATTIIAKAEASPSDANESEDQHDAPSAETTPSDPEPEPPTETPTDEPAAEPEAATPQPVAQEQPQQAAQPAAAPAPITIPIGGSGDQSAVDACRGAIYFTPYQAIGITALAQHWGCGGSSIYAQISAPGTLVSVDGANYRSVGVVATLNIAVNSAADIPAGYPLYYQTCVGGSSASMVFVALTPA